MLQTIQQALDWARNHVDLADARVLMQHVLACDAAYLIVYAGTHLDEPRLRAFHALVDRRITGEPVAYLTGVREFYGRQFKVTPAVLIPRPETEVLVDAALEHITPNAVRHVLDLATGSGCVAITIAGERPAARVTASDDAPEAIEVARANARALGVANVDFRTGDWFGAVRGEHFALVTANPPYVASDDPHLVQGDLRFEPRTALVGGVDGLECICQIVAGAPRHLEPGGWLVFEHGYDQAAACRRLLKAAGFSRIASRRDIAGHERVTAGQRA